MNDLSQHEKALGQTHILAFRTVLVLYKQDDQLYLARKKAEFGTGKLNSAGGKQESDETILETGFREGREEFGAVPRELEHLGQVTFIHPDNPHRSQVCDILVCEHWTGPFIETAEMEKAEPYPISNLPYDQMWQSDRYWLPFVLEGRAVSARFTFDAQFNIVSYDVAHT